MKQLEEQMLDENDDGTGITDEQRQEIKEWNEFRLEKMLQNRLKKSSKPTKPKSKQIVAGADQFAKHLQEMGIDPTSAIKTIKRDRSRGRKRGRSTTVKNVAEIGKKKSERCSLSIKKE